MSEDKDKPRSELIKLGERGLNLTSYEDAWRFARGLIDGGSTPRGLDKPGAVVGIIEAGLELGVPPMMALSHIQFVNGRVTCDGDLALALVTSKGGLKPGTSPKVTYDGDPYTPDWTCTVELWKVGASAPVSMSFSLREAIAAGLCKLVEGGKLQTYKRSGDPSGWGFHGAPWSNYPKRMLYYRPLGFLLRDHFSEYTLGLVISQEMQDYGAGPGSVARVERDITPPKGQDPLLEQGFHEDASLEGPEEPVRGTDAVEAEGEERVDPQLPLDDAQDGCDHLTTEGESAFLPCGGGLEACTACGEQREIEGWPGEEFDA